MQNLLSSNEYRQQDVMGASPVKLIIMVYDLAIRACEQKDFIRATKAVSVLRDALNFDFPDVSVGLFRVYQWCLDCIRKDDYDSALKSLKELRSAWYSSEKSLGNRRSNPNSSDYTFVSQAG